MSLIGANLDNNSYYATNHPFIDRIKTGQKWGSNTSAGVALPLVLDENGWPMIRPTDGGPLFTYFAIDQVSLPMTDRYVVTYEGTGTLDFLGATIISREAGKVVIEATGLTKGVADWAQLRIMTTDPNDHVRDIQIVREDQVALHEAGEIFNPAFLEKVEDWRAIRFMDWGNTNRANLGTGKFDDRIDADYFSYGPDGIASVPIEIMVALCNRVGSDMWFNVPHNADDDYIRRSAEYILENLDPRLNVYIEYSNEVWNFGFQQSKYAIHQGNLLWGKDINEDGVIDTNNPQEHYASGWLEYYGYRAAQMAAITSDVFSHDRSRLMNVIAPQTANKNEFYIFRGIEKAAVGGAAELFDSYAITGYFGHSMFSGSDMTALGNVLLQWARSGEAGMAAAFRQLEYGDVLSQSDGSLSWLSTFYNYHNKVADKYGLSLDMYEGGHHLITNLFPASMREEIGKFFLKLFEDSRMGDLYVKNYEIFKEAGGDLFTQYTDIDQATTAAHFASLQTVYDSGSARWDAYHAINTSGEVPDGRSLADFENGVTRFATEAGTDVLGGGGGDLLVAHAGGSRLYGGAGYDRLVGGAGNDILDGGAGVDRMTGGAGDDTYHVDDARDVVIEAANEGIDTVIASVDWVLGDNVENLVLEAAATRGTGNALDNVLHANPNRDSILIGGAGNDTYHVARSGDVIIEQSGEGIDTVIASVDWVLGDNIENLVLTGAATRGTGNALDNILYANQSPPTEAAPAAMAMSLAARTMVQELESAITTQAVPRSGIGWVLGKGLETVIGYAPNSSPVGTPTGPETPPVPGGDTGSVEQPPAPGGETGGSVEQPPSPGGETGGSVEQPPAPGGETGGSVEQPPAPGGETGGSVEQPSAPGDGDEGVSGGGGALVGSVLAGGAGNDTYYVYHAGDRVIELADEGIDTVHAAIDWVLGDNIENLVLEGTAVRGTGNALDNRIVGNDQDNILSGGAGDDVLIGGGGRDLFRFGAGDGHDRVLDFDTSAAGHDRVEITGFTGDRQDFLATHVFQTGAGAEIRLDDDSVLLLASVRADALTSDMFLFG